MRLFSLAFLCALAATNPARAHDTAADPALHCAALTVLSGEILASGGQASEDDLAVVREIAGLMLLHVDLPKNQRSDALRTYTAEFRRTHSEAEIAAQVEAQGDTCLEKFANN